MISAMTACANPQTDTVPKVRFYGVAEISTFLRVSSSGLAGTRPPQVAAVPFEQFRSVKGQLDAEVSNRFRFPAA